MSRTLELPDELYTRIETVAAKNGNTPIEWLNRNVPEANGASPQPEVKKTLRERLHGIIGSVSSGGQERLSENTGEKFTDYLEQKRREGRL